MAHGNIDKLRAHFLAAPFAAEHLSTDQPGRILALVEKLESAASVAALEVGDDVQYQAVKRWANRAYVLLGAPDEQAN